jgi:hypothetical protein
VADAAALSSDITQDSRARRGAAAAHRSLSSLLDGFQDKVKDLVEKDNERSKSLMDIR